MEFKKAICAMRKLNIRSVWFNFHYLPFCQALRLPILVSNKCYIIKAKGSIDIKSDAKIGMIQIGYGHVGIFDKKRSRSVLEIAGVIEFNGGAVIGHGSKISVAKGARLIFGNKFVITAESSIVCRKRIEFGDSARYPGTY